MKDIYQILEQKEADIARVRKEIASLQIVRVLFSNESSWKDAYECLHHKAEELVRVRKQIESLQIVAPLLSDELHGAELTESASSAEGVRPAMLKATGTESLFSSVNAAPVPKFWQILKRKT